jgi:hypothetical membrane protein
MAVFPFGNQPFYILCAGFYLNHGAKIVILSGIWERIIP